MKGSICIKSYSGNGVPGKNVGGSSYNQFSESNIHRVGSDRTESSERKTLDVFKKNFKTIEITSGQICIRHPFNGRRASLSLKPSNVPGHRMLTFAFGARVIFVVFHGCRPKQIRMKII